jgi:hypothetical protein
VTSSGKRMPIDAEPVSGGEFLLEEVEGSPVPKAVFIGQRNAYTGDRYRSHYATCPHAAQWRRS